MDEYSRMFGKFQYSKMKVNNINDNFYKNNLELLDNNKVHLREIKSLIKEKDQEKIIKKKLQENW